MWKKRLFIASHLQPEDGSYFIEESAVNFGICFISFWCNIKKVDIGLIIVVIAFDNTILGMALRSGF